MKEEILKNINEPRQLERLYRTNKVSFKREFTSLYVDLKDNSLANFWNERLNYESDEIALGSGKDLIFVMLTIIVAGLIAKLPAFLGIREEFFYSRNIGFILFPVLMSYFTWKNKLSTGKIVLMAVSTIVSAVFINFLPDHRSSDTLMLSCGFLLLFLWSILGFAFIGETGNNDEKRLAYLKYNGDLTVITALIVIAGGIMTGVTIGLFTLIGYDIRDFYFKNIVAFGLPAAPIVGSYLTQTNPQLVGKVSPVIAKIFSPLVLVMLVTYLVAILYSAKDPYNDREFLLIFNGLLVGVMAIIFFSVAETSTTGKNQSQVWILFLLSIVTIVVNGIALSAILFRISEWGITPNRAAVLGSNALILINLLLVTVNLYSVARQKESVSTVGKTISRYLPIYLIWTMIVTFLFPFIFGFK
jgi:hypothetical protein